MSELEEKVSEVLNSFNETFDMEIEQDNDIVTNIKINELKNDGAEFIDKFCSLFGPLITQLSANQKEIVFEETTGLVIKNIS